MTDMMTTKHPAVVDDWLEVEPSSAPATVTRRIRPAGDLDAEPGGGVCLCWRCRGRNLPTTEMHANDRILGRHLAKQPAAVRDRWLSDFQFNARHSPTDVAVVLRWVDIALGFPFPEPVYTVHGDRGPKVEPQA